MFRPKLFRVAAVIAVLLGATLSSLTANAASVSGSGDGLRVSPVRTDLTIRPGQSKSVTVYVQNITKSTVSLQTIINDFTAGNNENGIPAVLLNPNQYAPTHSLKRYITPLGNITIGPEQTKNLQLTISIPSGTPAGGYFGLVRFAPLSGGGGGNVSLSASVGSLILVTVPGNLQENLTIASFDARSISRDKKGQTHERTGFIFTSSKNLNAVVRFNNQGNVQEEPFGKILLENRSGKVLASYELNNAQPRDNVLPDSIRKFAVPLTKVGSFGKYTLVGNFGYGNKGQLLTAKTSFYVIPVWLILFVLLLIVLVVLGIIYLPRMVRAYNRRVLRRAGRLRR